MTIKNYKKISAILTLALALLAFSYTSASAVRITPPRLVIGANVKVQHMFIKNTSNQTESYRFSWKHLAMDKQGNILNLDKIGLENAPQGYRPLNDVIRFSPRRAILKSGQTQRVTFLVKRSAQLSDGEYRSHFLVQREPKKTNPVPNETPTSDAPQNTNEPASSPAVAVDVLISRAVPIYVLQGQTNAELKLLNVEIKKNTNKTKPHQPDNLVHFKVQKTGNRSLIGIASIYCDQNGKEVKISKASKVFAVYAEGEYRDEQVAVQIPSSGCNAYNIKITGHHDDPLAGKILAKQAFQK